MGLRLGLAGLGAHGLRYARHLLNGDVDGARLTAVCRRDAVAGRRFAEQHGLAFAADPTALVSRDDVDAIVAVLPPDLHPRIACAALGAGKPVLVEKPLAPDAAAARAVAREVARTGTPLMVAQTLRFDPLVQRLKLEAASLGPLSLVSINQRFEPTDRPWIDTPGPGGILLNTGVHGFDLLRYLTGLEPTAIRASCGSRVTRRTEDHFVATLRLEPGGVLAVLDNARTTRSRSGRIELVGEDGQLWGDHIHRTLQRVRGREIVELGPVPAEPTIPRALAAFVRCVREGSPSPVPVTDGVAALEMVDAARRSCDDSGSQDKDGATA
jgi:myo-inositol 2-dehydrogenase/D-chiro-inositol 1-dehydrogenase